MFRVYATVLITKLLAFFKTRSLMRLRAERNIVVISIFAPIPNTLRMANRMRNSEKRDWRRRIVWANFVEGARTRAMTDRKTPTTAFRAYRRPPAQGSGTRGARHRRRRRVVLLYCVPLAARFRLLRRVPRRRRRGQARSRSKNASQTECVHFRGRQRFN